MDLGDIIGATGYVFVTKTGETSLHASTVTLLAKSLKPLPVVKRDESGQVFDAVTDPEFRYRQRYADLIINPEVKERLIKFTTSDFSRVTYTEAVEIEKKYKELHKGIYAWGDSVFNASIKTGYIESVAGWKLKLPKFDEFLELQKIIKAFENGKITFTDKIYVNILISLLV
jgi:aminopeptidase-like protein